MWIYLLGLGLGAGGGMGYLFQGVNGETAVYQIMPDSLKDRVFTAVVPPLDRAHSEGSHEANRFVDLLENVCCPSWELCLAAAVCSFEMWIWGYPSGGGGEYLPTRSVVSALVDSRVMLLHSAEVSSRSLFRPSL